MTQDELKEMIAIAPAPSIPVMKFGDHWSGNEKQENANGFWQRLGRKYGFEWDSCEAAPGKGHTFFLATPAKPEETPEQRYEREVIEHKAYCDRIKPKKENYLTTKAFDADMAEWNMKVSCDAPNKPGYYRANND